VTLAEDIFLDDGRSGYTGEHLGEEGQLRRFIDLVDAGRIEPGSYLIVNSLDRLTRQSVWDALPRFMSLIERGIRIVRLMDNKMYTREGGV
jgi:DNA invertase Pin-like site-specific DNA recombinase